MSHDVSQRPALISRPPVSPRAPDEFLSISPKGDWSWTSDPAGATAFASMREAARFSLRLPSHLRAFGLPLSAELATHTVH